MAEVIFSVKIKFMEDKRTKDNIRNELEDFINLMVSHGLGLYSYNIRGVI